MLKSAQKPQAHQFVDASTRAVLRIDDFLARLKPDSRAGQKRVAALRHFGPESRPTWTREMGRLAEVDRWSALNPDACAELRQALAEIPELERAGRKLRAEEVLEEAELFQVKQFLYYARAAVRAAAELLRAWEIPDTWPADLDALMQAIHPQKHPTPRFHLAAELSPELDALRAGLRGHKKQERTLRQALEDAITADYGGNFDIHGGYRPANDAALGDEPRLEKTPRGWRLKDPGLRAAAAHIASQEAEIDAVEYTIRARLSRLIGERLDWLDAVADCLATLDIRLAKVRLRRDIDGCWPSWREVPGTVIAQGREPEVEDALCARGQSIQPIDVATGEKPVVVTGPNMGGKSVLLRLLGLAQWCAQFAMPVPARRCECSPAAAIIYVGAEETQNTRVEQGLSSFGREVKRLVDFWEDHNAGYPRLWLLDEVGRGTHPEEGAEIARELIESLARRGDRVVAATHFPRVAALPSALKLRIAGLTDPQKLQALLADETLDVQAALGAAMDYRPISADNDPTGPADVPRDARLVARALGLKLASDLKTSARSTSEDD